MRLSDDDDEDEDPVLRGKRLWKQWQLSRMQQNDNDAADGEEEGCSAAESLLQALSKSKKLKRSRLPPVPVPSMAADQAAGDAASGGGGADAAAAAAAAVMPPLVSAQIQQLSRTRCCV